MEQLNERQEVFAWKQEALASTAITTTTITPRAAKRQNLHAEEENLQTRSDVGRSEGKHGDARLINIGIDAGTGNHLNIEMKQGSCTQPQNTESDQEVHHQVGYPRPAGQGKTPFE